MPQQICQIRKISLLFTISAGCHYNFSKMDPCHYVAFSIHSSLTPGHHFACVDAVAACVDEVQSKRSGGPIHCGATIVPHLAVTFRPAPPMLATSPSPPGPGRPLTERQGSPRASTSVRSPAMPHLRAAVPPPSSPPTSSFASAELLPRRRAPTPRAPWLPPSSPPPGSFVVSSLAATELPPPGSFATSSFAAAANTCPNTNLPVPPAGHLLRLLLHRRHRLPYARRCGGVVSEMAVDRKVLRAPRG